MPAWRLFVRRAYQLLTGKAPPEKRVTVPASEGTAVCLHGASGEPCDGCSWCWTNKCPGLAQQSPAKTPEPLPEPLPEPIPPRPPEPPVVAEAAQHEPTCPEKCFEIEEPVADEDVLNPALVSEAQIDTMLRERGGDPEAIAARGEALVQRLREQHQFPTALPIPNWSTKKTSAGGVVIYGLAPTEIDLVYLVKPTNGFGGYQWVFPKGRVEDGMSKEATALKEVREEAGLTARVMPNGYLGVGEGTTSVTHYYVMLRIGGHPHSHEAETEEVILVQLSKAKELFLSSGNRRDAEIASRAEAFVNELRKRLGYA
jgi:8-oxo-dGTP pyrophosphatase MutT (NUDIX family)